MSFERFKKRVFFTKKINIIRFLNIKSKLELQFLNALKFYLQKLLKNSKNNLVLMIIFENLKEKTFFRKISKYE